MTDAADPVAQPITRDVWPDWSPPPPAKAVDWIPRHILLPDETETPGPFDYDLVPHVRGVLEAVDDPHVRDILLLWAARNAKTTTALSCLIFWSVTAPRPAVFASANEELADRTIQDQLYPLLEKCDLTRPMLLPSHRRNRRWVKLARNRIRRAFSGSRATLRGYPAAYAVANEVSAWTKAKNVDASALRMLAQRGKLYPFDRKFLYESTPGLAGACQISELFDADGVDRRGRWVPCPHCGAFQQLVFGTRDPEGPGVKWEKDDRGRSDPQRAEDTAWYRCVHGCAIHDCDRAPMMRAGLWVSEGQTVDDRGRLHGEPRFPRSSKVGFGPLSTLYSLLIKGWGQIARDFLDAQGSSEALRDFTNSTLALKWDPKPQEIPPSVLAERLCEPHRPSGVVPAWARFLTAGVDAQEHAQRFPWSVHAWGPHGRGQMIAHGEAGSFAELRTLLDRSWPVETNAALQLPILLTLIDSGYHTAEIYRFAWTTPRVKPCKGANHAFDKLYREEKIEGVPGMTLVHVNTHKSQDWMQRLIDGGTARADPGFWSLPADAAYDVALLDELMNEVRIRDVDDAGYPTERWVRRATGRPNDQRDTCRYAWTAAQILTQHGARWNALPEQPIARAAPEAAPRAESRPADAGDRRLVRRTPSWRRKPT